MENFFKKILLTVLILAFLFSASIVISGCGKKGPPLPPEEAGRFAPPRFFGG